MYLTHPDSASAIGASIATSGHVIKSVVLSIHGGLVQSCCYQRISSLEEVVVPDGVTEIGCAAFESCCSLRGCALEMFHPPAVEMELGPWAFESCKNLRSVTLPIGGSKISTCAFRGCDCITNLTVPCSSRAYVDQNDVEYSDPNRQSGTLFGLGCVRVLFLDNLSIWSALGTRELSELTVGEGVEKISSQFNGLNNLKTLKFSTSLKDVGDEAFAGLVGLQSFELPDSIESIGRNVFDGIPQGFVHRHDGVEYVGACAVGVDADDVERVVIEPGTCLISNAFHNCAQLREVVLPNSIRCFGTDAFSGCVSLESFVVPKGCKVIGGNAFGGCTILKNVYVPSSVERIGSSFCGCSPSLTFEVESVGRWASANYYAHYTGAYALTCRGDEVCDVTVAARNEYASRWSFKNCSSLRRASLDASVKELPKQAFYACASLAELTLTKGLRAVRQDACQGCKMLSSLSLPDGVEVIETWAFRDCPN